MSRGSASHVASSTVNHPPSPSQRPPAQSDLRRLKALQICSSTQGRSRFHKRLCQNDAGVRCLSISMMSSPWTQWPTDGRLEYLVTCRPVEISTRFRIPNLIELIYTIVKWKNQNSQLQSYRTLLHFFNSNNLWWCNFLLLNKLNSYGGFSFFLYVYKNYALKSSDGKREEQRFRLLYYNKVTLKYTYKFSFTKISIQPTLANWPNCVLRVHLYYKMLRKSTRFSDELKCLEHYGIFYIMRWCNYPVKVQYGYWRSNTVLKYWLTILLSFRLHQNTRVNISFCFLNFRTFCLILFLNKFILYAYSFLNTTVG